jgi:hypothetical protein
MIILKGILRKEYETMPWIICAQNRDQKEDIKRTKKA